MDGEIDSDDALGLPLASLHGKAGAGMGFRPKKRPACKVARKLLVAFMAACLINMVPATLLAGEYSPAVARVVPRPAWIPQDMLPPEW